MNKELESEILSYKEDIYHLISTGNLEFLLNGGVKLGYKNKKEYLEIIERDILEYYIENEDYEKCSVIKKEIDLIKETL